MDRGFLRIGLAFISMLKDVLRGRLPREPDGFAIFSILVLAAGAAAVLLLGPKIDAWLTARFEAMIP